jgi:hypothetical protein
MTEWARASWQGEKEDEQCLDGSYEMNQLYENIIHVYIQDAPFYSGYNFICFSGVNN